jgi:hypothetical protein
MSFVEMLLTEQLLFDESHVFVGVKKVRRVPGGARPAELKPVGELPKSGNDPFPW